MAEYLIPAQDAHAEVIVKRSEFLAFARHTEGTEEAKAFIHSLKNQYPDARHHCYAYIAGKPTDSNLYGFSDDNEPSGTAGMPIFTHLKHSQVGEVTLVVVRYFGGTKLGTGGLARAYGDAARQVLIKLETKKRIKMELITLNTSFELEAEVRKCIENAQGKILNVIYSEKVRLECSVPAHVISNLRLPYSVSVEDKSSI